MASSSSSSSKVHAMEVADLQELRAAAARVAAQDVHLGRFCDLLVLHVAHAFGLDPADVDAEQARAEEKAAARDAAAQQPPKGKE